MGERRVFDDESGGEDAGGEFAAVEAVADEHLGEVLAFDWLLLAKMVSYRKRKGKGKRKMEKGEYTSSN